MWWARALVGTEGEGQMGSFLFPVEPFVGSWCLQGRKIPQQPRLGLCKERWNHGYQTAHLKGEQKKIPKSPCELFSPARA